MPVNNREAVFRNLREWLCTANPKAATMCLEPDTDIIESRILESLQVVEFILYLERRTGRSILVEHLNPATLRTLNTIYASFFEPRP